MPPITFLLHKVGYGVTEMGNWSDGDNIWGAAITEADAKFYAHSCMPYGAGTSQTYSNTWPANVLYYNFVSYSSGAVSELGIRSNQAIPGADPIEVGIFEDTGTGRPGALLGSIVFDMDNKSGAISSNQWRRSL